MVRTWRDLLWRACRQHLPRIHPPEPDPDHERDEKIAKALAQAAEGRRQLTEAIRLNEPMAATAARLREARDQNHFSARLEQMLREGYGRAGTEGR